MTSRKDERKIMELIKVMIMPPTRIRTWRKFNQIRWPSGFNIQKTSYIIQMSLRCMVYHRPQLKSFFELNVAEVIAKTKKILNSASLFISLKWKPSFFLLKHMAIRNKSFQYLTFFSDWTYLLFFLLIDVDY